MKSSDLIELERIADAVYLRNLKDLIPLQMRAEKLRTALARLGGRQQATVAEAGMQLVGADVSWSIWAARTRQEINVELARVIGEERPLADAARRALGRREALRELIEKERQDSLRCRRKASEMQLLNALAMQSQTTAALHVLPDDVDD